MSSHAASTVTIQISVESVLSPPSWFGEVVLIVTHLRSQGILSKVCERIRFARPRFGRYEVIDFLAVLFGYAKRRRTHAGSVLRNPQAICQPLYGTLWARPVALAFGTLEARLAALAPPVIDALRTLFLEDGLARPLCADAQEAGLLDRQGNRWIVFDVDGTREAARQRALPQTDDLPAPQRRLDEVCAPGYTGRKRGEVVHTRTVESFAHSYQWLGSFGNKGNGRYRDELRRATSAIDSYLISNTSQRVTVWRSMLPVPSLCNAHRPSSPISS